MLKSTKFVGGGVLFTGKKKQYSNPKKISNKGGAAK